MMTRLKALRTDRGMKQREVAEYLDITKQGYSLIEQGKRQLKLEYAMKIAKLYGISLDEVVA